MDTIGPIELGEIKAVRFDFVAEAGAGAVLTLPAVTCTLFEGVDTAPDAVLVGLPSVTGQALVQRVQAGVPGCTYKLDAWVTDAGGLRHHIATKLSAIRG